jgi:ABC-type sugar transport system substrate-binding protein
MVESSVPTIAQDTSSRSRIKEFVIFLMLAGFAGGLVCIFSSWSSCEAFLYAFVAAALVEILRIMPRVGPKVSGIITLPLLVAFLLGSLLSILVTYWLRETPKAILYLSPVRDISSQPFYTEFLQYLVQKSKASGLDVVVWFPDQDFSGQSQRALLNMAAEQKRHFGVVIFTPFLRDAKSDEEAFFQFISRMQGSNVVLFDTDFSDSLRERISKSGLSIPPCEKGDEVEGGKLAASAVLNYFSTHHLPNPVVAVFDSPSGGTRSAVVRQALNEGAKAQTPPLSLKIIEWTSINYGRNEAREVAESSISSGQKIDAVFSGNDASALGVREAILQLRSVGNPYARRDIRIVGYDGSSEVRRLLRSSDENLLLNSVDVGLSDQADNIVWLAGQLIQGNHGILRNPNQGCGAVYKPRLAR